MARTLLLVGTRKGLFTLESDEGRRDWSVRGPFCESWPVYHAVHDPKSGSIYAAAASEWFGQAVWRSKDLGETWEHSSEGIGYGDDSERKISKVSSLAVADGRVLVGVEAPGIFASDDGGATWSLLDDARRPARQRGLGRPGEPAAGPPRHLRDHVRPGRREARVDDRPGHRRVRVHERRHRVDAAQQGPARRLAARARGGRLLRPPARPLARRPDSHVPAEPRRHAPQRRRRPELDGDHRRPADGVRVRGGGASAGPRHVLRDPARPGSRPNDAGGQGGGLAHARRRRELAAPRQRAAADATPISACCARR